SAQHDELLDTLHALSAAVTKAVAYKPGVTTTTTTAADAVRIGAGVCQDHAHVFVSAARSLGVPARYVVGYLLADEDGNEVVETHAWAEAFCRDVGWIGFDASNAVSPTERYIRLGCGHDATAATPIRGTLTGDAIGSLSAKVSITPDAAQQSQQQSQSGV
ncbi:MAG: transglutaminase family protein, partial [Pseudomonadota bacterium]